MDYYVLAKSVGNNGEHTQIYERMSYILAKDKVQQFVDIGFVHATDRTEFNERPCGRGDVRVVMLIHGKFI